MIPILGALLPIFALIILGFGFRRGQFPGDGFWPLLERLVYFVLFPALLVDRLSQAELAAFDVAPIAGAAVVSVFIVGGSVRVLKRFLRLPGPIFGAVFMGAVRFNTYVGLAASEALWNDAGLTLAAIVLAVWVPFVNLISVWVLLRHHPDGLGRRASWPRLVTGVIGNPLIIACALGVVLNITGIGLPFGVDALFAAAGAAALPLGLLAVGAGLDLGAVRRAVRPLLWASGLKLAVMPALMMLAARLFDIDGLSAAVLVLFAALPGSPAAYILARQMGADARLMAGIVTVTTVASPLTLTLWIMLVT